MENNQITQLIIITIKDVIYQKRKKGNNMTLGDVKRSLLKNLNMCKLSEMMKNNIDQFNHNWNTFIDTLKTDKDTMNSWYKL